jgi:hypothetical protein
MELALSSATAVRPMLRSMGPLSRRRVFGLSRQARGSRWFWPRAARAELSSCRSMKPDARETRLMLWLSDFGPLKPIAPVAPAAPQGTIDDPAYILAMVEFWPVMEAHAKAIGAYTAATVEYVEWHSMGLSTKP